MNNTVLKIFCGLGLAYVVIGIIWMIHSYYTSQTFSIFRFILIVLMALFCWATIRWLQSQSNAE